MVQTLSIILSLFVVVSRLCAITWEFPKEGDSQGWIAQEGLSTSSTTATISTLRSEVGEGVWRVFLPPFISGQKPAISIISPHLGYDSDLFDKVAIRFRVMHHSPLVGDYLFWWVNSANRDSPIRNMFTVRSEITYTTQWQELIIKDLQLRASDKWKGELIDIRFNLILIGDGTEGSIATPGDIPEAVEIDRIVLTGVEEQLQGELSPPSNITVESSGTLFTEADFNPLDQKGIRGYAALGDVDGDRDLDLVATYSAGVGIEGGLFAFNDGEGNFSAPYFFNAYGFYLRATDVDGDGLMDLLVRISTNEWEYRRNDGENGWRLAETFRDLYPVDWGDADGDGDMDLWMIENPAQKDVVLWLQYNDGAGNLNRREKVALDLSDEGFIPGGPLVQHLQKDTVTGIKWLSADNEPGYKITYLDDSGEVTQRHLAVNMGRKENSLIRYMGDFDRDGDIDFVSSISAYEYKFTTYRGLEYRVNKGDGTFESIIWHDEVELSDDVLFLDLNEDGILDPVFVDINERHPAVMVHLGVAGGGLPQLEGVYPLRGQGGAVLGGDVDGDGDVDLVVLERAVEGQGGVHVLLNRLNEQTAAVLEEGVDLPPSFHLGPNYPNPFNPQTWIPFDIPADSNPVRLRIYNLLGQPIRTLMAGPLSIGSHVVPWDGRDGTGQVVSSGLYFYCLQVGPWIATGKMVKSE